MTLLILGMLVCIVLAAAVVGLVAIPARREGRDLLAPKGEQVVSAVRSKTGGAAARTGTAVGSAKATDSRAGQAKNAKDAKDADGTKGTNDAKGTKDAKDANDTDQGGKVGSAENSRQTQTSGGVMVPGESPLPRPKAG